MAAVLVLVLVAPHGVPMYGNGGEERHVVGVDAIAEQVVRACGSARRGPR